MKLRPTMGTISLACSVLFIATSFQGQAQGILPADLDPFRVSQIALRQTWIEQRIEPVVLQRYDEGCGPAALATVLRFLFDADVSEQELLEEMLREKIEAGATGGGFTFLDLVGAVQRRGYEPVAGRAPLEELRNLTLPAIVLLDRRDLRHFVVLWGVVEDRVHLGDPLIGNTTIPLADFAREWLGVLLIVLPPSDQLDEVVAKVGRHVRQMESMSLRRRDPFSLDFAYRSLVGDGVSLLVPTPGEF